jgi:hypothetical protein
MTRPEEKPKTGKHPEIGDLKALFKTRYLGNKKGHTQKYGKF